MKKLRFWVRLAAAVLLLLLFGAIRACGPEEESPPEIPPPVVTGEPWATTVLFDRFELSMPGSWLRNPEPAMQHGMLFRGPSDGGHPPTVQLYWGPWAGDPAGFFEHERARRVPGFQDILEEGEATVAGLPARYLVYEQRATMKGDARPTEFLTIDWYFARDGRGGILRGLAPAQTFRFQYRPLFTRIARKLRYRVSR